MTEKINPHPGSYRKAQKNKTLKLAMDSKQTNKTLHKNKYQMPNIDLLFDNVAQSVQAGNPSSVLPFFNSLSPVCIQ